MNRCNAGIFLVVIMMFAGIVTASAQSSSSVEVISNVRFQTENTSELPVNTRFGFGNEFTDSTDYNKGEFLVPGPPPVSFYVLFTDMNIGLCCNKDRSNIDVRGVPDSVLSGKAEQFSLVYEVQIWRNLGKKVYCYFPLGLLPKGADSVVMSDFFGGSVFKHTFVNNGGAGTDTGVITNEGLDLIKITAYYNYRKADVPYVRSYTNSGLTLYPNPLRNGSSLNIREEVLPGYRIVVSNSIGSTVRVTHINQHDTQTMVPMTDVPSGVYTIAIISKDGRVVKRGAFVKE